MARYFNSEDRAWTPVDVRGTMMDKAILWDAGFDIQSSMFRMTQDMVIARHTHQHWVQVVVIEGEMRIEADSGEGVHIRQGGCYLLAPGDTHVERAVTDSIVLVTQLDDHPAYPVRRQQPQSTTL